jgi:hypothetical protein
MQGQTLRDRAVCRSNLTRRHKNALAMRDRGARCLYCGERRKIYDLTKSTTSSRCPAAWCNDRSNLGPARGPCNQAKA